jgi:predicted TIM-barrel fold metal-dependent hydrolase
MNVERGAIDCDVHPTVPDNKALLPYLDDFWRDSVVSRGINSLESISYPTNSPLTSRPEWRGQSGFAATDPKQLASQVFDRWQAGTAVLNCLYGVHLCHSEDMARAFARAVNDWIVKEWLDRDPRLRASIVVPMQNAEYAVDEIERCAKDKRFVQVLAMAMQELPLGRRHYWPTWYLEDYAAQSQGFQSQVASLITEGVFAKHSGLKVVLMESGITWVPPFLWRFDKFWRGLRTEVPWVDRAPWEMVRDHFRLTLQPLDAPDDPHVVERAIEHLRSDEMLLYASDFPHWQFEGDDVMPAGISPALRRKIAIDNPRATYARLNGGAS